MKKLLIALLVILIAVGVAFAVLMAKPEQEPTVSEVESASVSETSEAAATTEPESITQADVSEPESESLTTAEDVSYVKTGVWYLYLDDSAYTFSFTIDSKVEISYYDSNNIEGLDAKYFSTGESYELKDGAITLDDPVNEGEEFVFTLKDKSVYFDKIKLENEKKDSLDIVFEHYNS